jgi:aarF domain-containing kinase
MASALRFVGRKAGVGFIGVVSSAGISYVAIKSDEGTSRSFQFWSKAFPIYIHYRSYQLLNRDLGILGDQQAEVYYSTLHDMYTDKVRNLVYGMRGFYLKNAQLLSTQDDFLPSAYMKWVKDTQDNVPSEFKGSEAKEYVRQKLKEECNLDFDDVFSSWDDKPLGVASIGEVHKATLKSNGKAVAVKLLCPGIEKRFRADIKTMKSFCQLAMPQHVPAFDEIEKQFCTEFDYREEAKNLSTIRQVQYPHASGSLLDT